MAANQYDAIVVGAGHNGLVAAGYLSRAGLRVLVLERRPDVGGPCGRVEYFPGYFGAITNSPGSLEPKIVQDMELERFGLRFTRPDPLLITPFEDGRAFCAWRDKAKSVEELKKFSEHDSVAYYEFFEYLEWFARRLRISLFAPPPSFKTLVSRLETLEEEEAFSKIFFGSIRDMLDERLESEQVKSLIAALSCVSNFLGPSTPGTPYMMLQRPLSLASMQAVDPNDPRRQAMRGSTGLPIGGMGSITDSMRRSIEAYGAVVRTNADVVSVIVKNDAVCGVALAGGEEFYAPIVVSNLNPKLTLLKLLDPFPGDPALKKRIEKLKMRGSAFKVALALDGMPRFLAAQNDEHARLLAGCQFRYSPSIEYMDRAYDDAKYGAPSKRPIIWGLTPSANDPTVAPPGKHVMSINIFHAPRDLREGNWTDLRETYGKQCIDQMCEFIPNLKDIITDVRYWSPQDFEEEYGLLESNITHGDMVPTKLFSFRPIAGMSDYRGPVAGLYMCGSGTFPGGFVTGLPGHNASHEVLKDLAATGGKIADLPAKAAAL
ncbi:MAG: phytoene desaturase family protein [Pseudorhodoplanes sp.]